MIKFRIPAAPRRAEPGIPGKIQITFSNIIPQRQEPANIFEKVFEIYTII